MNTSRENILGSIRKSLQQKVDKPFPNVDETGDIYTRSNLTVEECYAEEFVKLGGKFVYCTGEQDFLHKLLMLADTMKWQRIHALDKPLLQMASLHHMHLLHSAEAELHSMEVGISSCEFLVARTGSAIMSSSQDYGRQLPVYAPIHITYAYTSQVVWDITDAMKRIQQKYPDGIPSMLSLTTGPSRTADIEKTLVVGVHGPKEVYTFLIEKE